MKTDSRKENLFQKTAYVVFALFPVVVIASYFLQKILTMKRFVFGDDVQLLKWFQGGRIAFPLWTIVSSRIEDGRFFPLCYENLNILSLLSPDLTLSNLAERCFYVQAVMWILTCAAFFVLVTYVAKIEKERIHPVLWLFVPLALLTSLCTPAFVSYFMMLIFPETRLCVLFLLFFLFYYLACRKGNIVWYVLAWLSATITIFCKENVFTFFLVICGVRFLFGWKDLPRKHKFLIFGLLASIVAFLLLYYFIVYRNMVQAYNAARHFNQSFFGQVMGIFRSYPLWIFAFLLGIFRLVRVVSYRERKHFCMDAMLFAILGFFISYLMLRLTDWWYWGVGIVVVMPVLFYWLIVSEKWWQRTAIFLISVLCLPVNVKPTCDRVNQMLLAQQQDPVFLEKVDGVKDGKKILFPAFTNDSQAIIEDACYQYLDMFLKKLGTPGKWQTEFIPYRDFPERLTPEDVCVVWQGTVRPPDFQYRLQMSEFQSIASCYFYEAFAYNTDFDRIWQDLPSVNSPVPAKAPFCLFDSRWATQEEWGRWVNGEEAEVAVAIPPQLRKKNLRLTFDVYMCVHQKNPVCKFKLLVAGKVLKEISSGQFINRFSVEIPSERTKGPRLSLTFENINPRSQKELGVSEDPRKLGVGIRSVTFEEIF